MMKYMFVPVWAVQEICFLMLLLSFFLQRKRSREQVIGIVGAAWLLTAAFGLLFAQGLYGYLMYLLAGVGILLTVFREYGRKGFGVLILAFGIPVITDMAVLYLAEELPQWQYCLAVTGGKLLPIGLVLGLRWLSPVRGESSGRCGERDMLLLRQHMEMQQESMTALEQSYRLQRRNTHEFEHHMQVLRDLLEREAVEAAREYLQRLKKNRSMNVMCVSSNHPVVDVILNQKYQTAQDNDIKMQVRVNDLSGLQLPADALVVVLTNLLDNAIEACRRLDGYREICCSIVQEEGLYISVRNTSEPVNIVDGRIPTNKEDSLSHGFGLLSVGYVLEELGAEYTFGYADGWFHFAADLE